MAQGTHSHTQSHAAIGNELKQNGRDGSPWLLYVAAGARSAVIMQRMEAMAFLGEDPGADPALALLANASPVSMFLPPGIDICLL